MINVFQPSLGEEELKSIEEVFKSNWIGKGKKVALFEELFADHIGSTKDRVITTNCCSEGLFSSMQLNNHKRGLSPFMIYSNSWATEPFV